MSEEITTPEINQAWDRIARTPDGQIIYRHLQRLAMALSDNVSALPVHEGGRILARNLMSLMGKGIAENDRYAVAFVTRIDAEPERARGTAARRKWLAEHTTLEPPDYGPAFGAGPTGAGSNGTGNGAGGDAS